MVFSQSLKVQKHFWGYIECSSVYNWIIIIKGIEGQVNETTQFWNFKEKLEWFSLNLDPGWKFIHKGNNF